MHTIAKLIMIVKYFVPRVSAILLLVSSMALTGFCQPGPLQPLDVLVAGGTETLAQYTPLAMSYYPYHNGVQNDTLKYVLGDQLTAGTVQTADRILDVTAGGAYAYRDQSGNWQGPLLTFHYGHALMFANHHEARTITLMGYPADSITYIFPMPTGSIRFAAPRMAYDHRIDSVGLCWSDFHKSGNMRQGGDLVIDMVTGQIARRDSSGWVGTMTHMRVAQPVIIQVNNLSTFDWMYNPYEE
jgi:hypothetical protein